VKALTGQSPAHFVDRVVDLASLRADIADELTRILANFEPQAWQHEASIVLSDAVDKTGCPVHSAADVGPRQLRRRFRSEHGFSPREYRRILRTDRLLRRLHPKPWEADSSEVAPDFADQPHMIREFKALTGVTPGAYVRSKRTHSDATLRSVIAENVPPPPLA
jgi:AraC-like DNA-binding protein